MRKALGYIIPAVCGVIVVFALLFARDTFHQTVQLEIYRDLCDAFAIPGMVLTGFGVIVFASNGGAFDMLKFSIIKMVDLLRRDLTKVKYRTFYDYRKAQEGNERSFTNILIVGVVFLMVAVVFWILFSSTYTPYSTATALL